MIKRYDQYFHCLEVNILAITSETELETLFKKNIKNISELRAMREAYV